MTRRRFTIALKLNFRGRRKALPIDDAVEELDLTAQTHPRPHPASGLEAAHTDGLGADTASSSSIEHQQHQ